MTIYLLALTIGMIVFGLVMVLLLMYVRERTGFISRRLFVYGFMPNMTLPLAVVMTYYIWSSDELNFGLRLLVALGIQIVVTLQLVIISIPTLKYSSKTFREYLEMDNKLKDSEK